MFSNDQMDEDMMLAIALSLEDEADRQRNNEIHKVFLSVYEYSHNTCGKTLLSKKKNLLLCPQCNNDDEDLVLEETLQTQPGTSTPRSICIKPTVGSFHNYNMECLLHCGVSDTTGSVFNFDSPGVKKDDAWNFCISVPITSSLSDSEWNKIIQDHFTDEASERTVKYHSLKNNCYDFVLRFLNRIHWQDCSSHTKEKIVIELIEKPIGKFEEYYRAFEALENDNFILKEKLQSSQPLRHCCDECGVIIAWQQPRFRCFECKGYDVCGLCVEQNRVSDPHTPQHRLFQTVEECVSHCCDQCHTIIASENRFHCADCPDYDVCLSCFEKLEHMDGHEFILL